MQCRWTPVRDVSNPPKCHWVRVSGVLPWLTRLLLMMQTFRLTPVDGAHALMEVCAEGGARCELLLCCRAAQAQ